MSQLDQHDIQSMEKYLGKLETVLEDLNWSKKVLEESSRFVIGGPDVALDEVIEYVEGEINRLQAELQEK
jgi:hypothetical protein